MFFLLLLLQRIDRPLNHMADRVSARREVHKLILALSVRTALRIASENVANLRWKSINKLAGTLRRIAAHQRFLILPTNKMSNNLCVVADGGGLDAGASGSFIKEKKKLHKSDAEKLFNLLNEEIKKEVHDAMWK